MISVLLAADSSAEFCPGVRGLFTSRLGGVSSGRYESLNLGLSVGDSEAAVRANRDRLIGDGAHGPGRLAWMRQVHGARVARAAESSPAPEADAIFTDLPGVGLGVLVADCAPVLLADPVARLAGAAHAGRPGLALGVVPALIEAMVSAGASPARMHAVIGPSICGRCYEVPTGLRDEVSSAAPGSACTTSKGTPGIDIRAGLHRQLAAAGVGVVADDPRCTAESDELYSYRRDGVTGRFAGLVWLA
jgi:YfiH family protein